MPLDPNRLPRTLLSQIGQSIGDLQVQAHGNNRRGAPAAAREFVVGDGTSTVFELYHGLNRRTVDAYAIANGGEYEDLPLSAKSRPSDYVIRVTFAQAPPAAGAVVVVR